MKPIFLFWLTTCLLVCCQQADGENATAYNPTIVSVPDLIIEEDLSSIDKLPTGEMLIADSLFSGYIISRYKDGSVKKKVGYSNGKQHGVTTAYYASGQVRYERPYVNGEKHGTHVGYHANGKKKFEYKFENGFSVGNHLTWYEDGSKESDMNYQEGKEFGKQQAWRPDGKLRSNYIVRENGRVYGLQGIKRCTKLDGRTQRVDPYKGKDS